ncbi:hypothetical protein PMNALOAF_0918 [Methylobacterium adhaesivum]|nr:hypothetical protein PMNALOAF_0918 [Methylobacterium adhaesivum]
MDTDLPANLRIMRPVNVGDAKRATRGTVAIVDRGAGDI